MKHQPWLQAHPATSKPNFEHYTLPLKFFGDGVACLGLAKSWGRSVDSLSVSPMLSQGTSFETNLLLTVVFKTRRVEATMKKVWKILAWSFAALQLGEHPRCDWTRAEWPSGCKEAALAGQALADGYNATIFARGSAKKVALMPLNGLGLHM